MQKTITITAMNRPALLQALLQSLVRNELDGWKIFVAIEPSAAAPELVGICESTLAGQSHEIAVNDVTFGIRGNPHRVLSHAFAAGSALNLYLEEDLLVSPDATTMALWYAQNHRPDWLCLNLLAGPCGSAALLSDPRFPEQLFLARTFNSIGFVVRRDEWYGLMEPNWFGGGLPELAGGSEANWRTSASGWDWSIYGLLAARKDLSSVQPVLARATHTGETGTNVTPEFHDKVFGGLPISERPVDGYSLVEIDDLDREVRPLVRAHKEMTELRLQLEKKAIVAGGALARLAKQDQKGGGAAWALRRWSSKTLKRVFPSGRRSTDHSLISVVMCVRDSSRYLEPAIRSILSQTESAFNFIIIDDGSTDDSMNIAKHFEDPRINLVEDGLHLGLAERLNRALDDASTEFVARMDPDDIAAPNRLERQLAFMTAHPEVGICGSWHSIFDREGRESMVRLPTKHFHIAARTLFGCPLAHPTVMFNMKHLNKQGLRYSNDAEYAEDYDLWERAHQRVRMANVPEDLLLYRLHPSQVTNRHGKRQRAVSDQVRMRALRRFGISATPEQLALHCAYSAGENLDHDDRRSQVIAWLRRIRHLKRSWRASDQAVRLECRLREAELINLRR